MLTNTRFHGWSDAESLMNAGEIVVHMKQRNHRNVVVEFFAERIRQTSEAAHVHPHVEILPFHVRRADMPRIRGTDDIYAFGPKTLRRAVTGLSLGVAAVYLHQLRVVHRLCKRIRNGHQVHLVAVRGQLDSVRQPALNIPEKLRRTPGIPRPYHPRNNQLTLRFNRRERPNVSTVPNRHFLSGDVPLFTANKRPNFVNLDTLCSNVADNAVLILSAGRADTHQKTKHSTFRYARHAGSRANGAAFHQRREYRDLLVVADYVCHNQTIRQRFRIVNKKVAVGTVLLLFFSLRPSRFRGLLCTTFSLGVRHGFEAALPADLATFRAHLAHHLLNDGELNRFSGFYGFQENASGVLDRIQFLCAASPLWHDFRLAQTSPDRQACKFSNGPTTSFSRVGRPRWMALQSPSSAGAKRSSPFN